MAMLRKGVVCRLCESWREKCWTGTEQHNAGQNVQDCRSNGGADSCWQGTAESDLLQLPGASWIVDGIYSKCLLG